MERTQSRDLQLQRPFPGPAVFDPSAVVCFEAMDEMLITRPGSVFVASFARRSVKLRKSVVSSSLFDIDLIKVTLRSLGEIP